MNGDVWSDLATLDFKNEKKLEEFHSIIIRIQQEIMLSGEFFSPTRHIFQYTKSFSNSDKLRSFVATKMTYLITFLGNNENLLYIQEVKFMESIVI